MSILVRGQLYTDWSSARSVSEIYKRESMKFTTNPKITACKIEAEPGRYHLYAGFADPWSHRVRVVHALHDLGNVIGCSSIDPIFGEQGWKLVDHTDENEFHYIYELYLATENYFTGRVSAPLLWDNKEMRIVSNDSENIMRIFDKVFNTVSPNTFDLYPAALSKNIDELNEFILDNVNLGQYEWSWDSIDTMGA